MDVLSANKRMFDSIPVSISFIIYILKTAGGLEQSLGALQQE